MDKPREIVAGIIINRDGRILMQHRDDIEGIRDRGKWSFPGGHMDEGEGRVPAVIREVKEETGLIFDTVHYLCSVTDQSGKPPFYIIHFYMMLSNTKLDFECNEGISMNLLHAEDILKLDVPVYTRLILQYYLEIQPLIFRFLSNEECCINQN